MQLSLIKRSAAIAIAAFSMAFSTQALAAIDLTTSSPNYLGNINDGIPSSLAAEAGYINTLLTVALGDSDTIGTETYNRSNNACATCPVASAIGAAKDETDVTGNFSVTGSFTYILAKYDAAQAGSYVWYVGDLGSQTFNLPTNLGTCGSGGCGLSHISTFGTSSSSTSSSVVAEPGSSSLAMLALGLLAAGFWTRRKA